MLVVAKSDRAHHGLARQFEDHSVTRRYLAVVHGVPMASDPRLRGLRGVTAEAAGVIRIATHLARHQTDRQRQAVVWEEGRHAVTRVRVIEGFGTQAALVECWLETGRTHQIRVHMAYVGHGLVGDQTYGGRRKVAEKAPGAEAGEQLPPAGPACGDAGVRSSGDGGEAGVRGPPSGGYGRADRGLAGGLRARSDHSGQNWFIY